MCHLIFLSRKKDHQSTDNIAMVKAVRPTNVNKVVFAALLTEMKSVILTIIITSIISKKKKDLL